MADIVRVVRARPRLPSEVTRIAPPVSFVRRSISSIDERAACSALFFAPLPPLPPLARIASTAVFARHTRIIASPCPVVEHAPASSSAYVPAPMIGESPTRPTRLFTMPPVLVAAAT